MINISCKKNNYHIKDPLLKTTEYTYTKVFNKETDEDLFYLYILCGALEKQTKKYNKEDFNKAKIKNYDAKYMINVIDKKNYILIEYKVIMLSEEYINKNIKEDILNIFKDFIDNNNFDIEDIKVKINSYNLELKSIYDNPKELLEKNIKDIIIKNDTYLRLDKMHNLIDNFDYDKLNDYVIELNKLDGFIINTDNNENSINEFNNNTNYEMIDYKLEEEYLEKLFNRGLDQANLMFIYKLEKEFSKDKLRVFNGIFGGSAISKLFKIVREKNSLCYSINSKMFDDKHIIIYVGLSKENLDFCTDLINDIIKDMIEGNLSEIDDIKKELVEMFLEQAQNYNFQKQLIRNQIFKDESIDIEKICNDINNVSKEDVIEIASNLKCVMKGIMV